MKKGLLWYDGDPKRATEKKIDDAADCYLLKFGVAPNTCYVSPNDVVSHPCLKIVAKPIVQANHFLVGVDEEPSAAVVESNELEVGRRSTRRAREKQATSAAKAAPAKKALRLIKS